MMPGMEFAISKTVLLAIVLAPLAGAILAGLFGRPVGRAGPHWITILGVAASCALSIYVLWQLVGQGDRKSVGLGKGVSVRVDHGVRRNIKNKNITMEERHKSVE